MRETVFHEIACGCGQSLETTHTRSCPRCGQSTAHLGLDLAHVTPDLPTSFLVAV